MGGVLLIGVPPDIATLLASVAPENLTLDAVDISGLDTYSRIDSIDIMVVGEDVADALRATQAIGSIAPSAAVMILCRAENLPEIEQRIRFTPFISRNVTLQSVDDPDRLGAAFQEALRRARRTRRHQAVLRQVSAQLPVPGASPERTRLYLDALLDYTPVGLILIDPADFSVLEWNREAGRLMGREEWRAHGVPLNELMPELSREKLEALMRSQDRTPEAIPFDIDGMDLVLDVSVAIVSENQQTIGAVVIVNDATNRVKAERNARRLAEQEAVGEALEAQANDLRQLNRILERRNRELQEFTYVATHDLKEPLRKISTFADLLETDYHNALDARALLYVSRMKSAALRMGRLMSALLNFSNVEFRGDAQVRVDLSEVVDQVLDDLSVLLTENQAVVRVGELPVIDADVVQMRQLFQNLISNAVKYRKPDITPQMRITATLTDEATAAFPSNARVAVIEVQDNGMGFEQRYAERIFKPFQRLHRDETVTGTGMGLAICRRIAERHGGSISAVSSPGQGSTFTVRLPVSGVEVPPHIFP